ncbi:hypothetical protein Fmac_022817 [Flemingia macrophylla]|uniref:adenylate kinase n=1 Tax=Flemingia macrophylla TaxID=520843 RepID=A0ABD1M2L8_9FABA
MDCCSVNSSIWSSFSFSFAAPINNPRSSSFSISSQRQRQRPRPRRFFSPNFRSPFAPNAINSRSRSRSRSLIVSQDKINVMISGAPASGKGTQCHLITNKVTYFLSLRQIPYSITYSQLNCYVTYSLTISSICIQYGLVHVAAGDLLRAEIATGSENGKRAKQYMEKGQLVPDEIVVMMVKDRLLQPDSKENGWLLDGYPRSLSQATKLKGFGFEPDIFLLLEVSEDVLVERVVGRRLDPVTGKIYHLKYSPPETEEIAARLTQRFDDTEEKVKLRLNTHHQNVESVLSLYNDITVKINGNVSKEEVFAQIDSALTSLVEQKAASGSMAT